MKKFVAVLVLPVIIAACTSAPPTAALKTGTWRATIEMQGQQMPFTFELVKDSAGGYDAYLHNAGERLLLDEITVTGDSVDIALHIFDTNIKARMDGDSLRGVFVKNYEKDYRIPFRAAHGQSGIDTGIG